MVKDRARERSRGRSASSTPASAGSPSPAPSSTCCRTSRSCTSATPARFPYGPQARRARSAATRSRSPTTWSIATSRCWWSPATPSRCARIGDDRRPRAASRWSGVIEPGTRAAVRATRNGVVGLIGTRRRSRAGAYDRAIAATGAARRRCTPAACPVFVEHVERGDTTSDELRGAARGYLVPLDEQGHRHLDPGLHALPAALGPAPDGAGPGRRAGVLGRGDRQGRVRHAAARRPASVARATAPAHEFLSTGDPELFQRVAGSSSDRSSPRSAPRGPARRRGLVELTVLGLQRAPGRTPAGATCGYLVSHEGANLWLDAGTGTFARAAAAHRHRRRCAAIVITPRAPRPLRRPVPVLLRAPLRRARRAGPAVLLARPGSSTRLACWCPRTAGR